MKPVLLLLCLGLLAAMHVAAKGHGGGHGGGHAGHSGGHSGGGHVGGGHTASHAASHSAAHSSGMHSGSVHSSGGHSVSSHMGGSHISGGGFHAPVHAAPHSGSHTIINRAITPSAVISNHPRKPHTNPTGYVAVPPRGDKKVDNPIPVYYGYGYYNPFYYSPFYYNPYFSIWSFVYSMGYGPSYATERPYDEFSDNNYPDDSLEGYVVYAHDTIAGAVTIGGSAVFLETADSVQSYDYKFRMRKKELEYVVGFNGEDKQVKLVRLQKDKNQMWRLVHVGKLNLYDDGKGLIYQPEDIDKSVLMAQYNGKMIKLNSFSLVRNKERLVQCINEAYGVQLDPRRTGWNELLIYLDKLD